MNKRTIVTLDNEQTTKNMYIITQEEVGDKKIVLHPFIKGDSFLKYLKERKISIITDKRVEMPELKKIKAVVYNLIQDAILNSDNNDIFWFRILGSVIFGLFLFFVAAILIPDPIPLADEFALAVVGGALFYGISVKYRLFNFVRPGKVEMYGEFINTIQIIDSPVLVKLNELYNEFYKNRMTSGNNGFDHDQEVPDYLKKGIGEFSASDIHIIKELFSIIDINYGFGKLKNGSKKLTKIIEKSSIEKERLFFYYLIFKHLDF